MDFKFYSDVNLPIYASAPVVNQSQRHPLQMRLCGHWGMSEELRTWIKTWRRGGRWHAGFLKAWCVRKHGNVESLPRTKTPAALTAVWGCFHRGTVICCISAERSPLCRSCFNSESAGMNAVWWGLVRNQCLSRLISYQFMQLYVKNWKDLSD